MNEERLKQLEALIYVGGLMPEQAQSLINRVRELERALEVMDDAAQDLWAVVANASGGNWEKETDEWREAAIRVRDQYFAVKIPYAEKKL